MDGGWFTSLSPSTAAQEAREAAAGLVDRLLQQDDEELAAELAGGAVAAAVKTDAYSVAESRAPSQVPEELTAQLASGAVAAAAKAELRAAEELVAEHAAEQNASQESTGELSSRASEDMSMAEFIMELGQHSGQKGSGSVTLLASGGKLQPRCPMVFQEAELHKRASRHCQDIVRFIMAGASGDFVRCSWRQVKALWPRIECHDVDPAQRAGLTVHLCRAIAALRHLQILHRMVERDEY